MTDLRERRDRDRPPPGGVDRRVDPLEGVPFAAPEAKEVALAVPLRPQDFDDQRPSAGRSGFTIEDVLRLAESGAWRTVDCAMVARALASATAPQRKFSAYLHPSKLAAKRVCTDLLRARLQPGARVLDVGGEAFYQPPLAAFEVVTHALPDHDMHAMEYDAEFDAAIAMHVLEHSPFPYLVLLLIARALKPGGLLYVAVPRPCRRFCSVEKYGHWSVMPAPMWAALLRQAGFQIEEQTSGRFGRRKAWIEGRFLCRRGEGAL